MVTIFPAMDDVRLGQLLRAARIRRGWRQADVAARAGISRQTVSRLERGAVGGVTLDHLRAVADVLEVQLDVVARWRGAEGSRLLSERHGRLAESVTSALHRFAWDVRPEVSFSIYGERGVVDLLAWHAPRRALLVIELKTEIVDVGELLGTLDRKARLARRIAGDLGWQPLVVGVGLIVEDRTMNRARARAHNAVLGAALPADGRALAAWLRRPVGRVAALSFWRYSRGTSATRALPPLRRVRRPTDPKLQRGSRVEGGSAQRSSHGQPRGAHDA
jgi:transcriptional regulator with XRE-family HTH domain